MSKLAPVVGVCVSVRPSVPCMTNRSPWNACQCQLQLRNSSSPWYTVRLDMTQIRDIGHIRRRILTRRAFSICIWMSQVTCYGLAGKSYYTHSHTCMLSSRRIYLFCFYFSLCSYLVKMSTDVCFWLSQL